MAIHVLCVTDGKMQLIAGDQTLSLPSERVAQYERSARQLEQRYEWKTSGEGARFMNQSNPYANASSQTGRITALAPLNGREMLYAVVFDELGGIYRKDYQRPEVEEGIVLSDVRLCVHDLRARGDRVVFSTDDIRGQRHIGMLTLGEPGYVFLTEGDTQDSGPFLSPDGQWVYYACAGYARNEQGMIVERGPMNLLRASVDGANLEEVLASAQFDYLRPKLGPDGCLYYIKRPYQPSQKTTPSILQSLLMPVQFVAGFIQFFIVVGKALSNAVQDRPPEPSGGPVRTKARQEQERMIDGAMVNIGKVSKENEKRGEKHPGSVPHSWELIRQTSDGTAKCLRRGVADYDLMEDGGIVLTNGRYVLRIDRDGGETQVAKGELLSRVAVVPEG